MNPREKPRTILALNLGSTSLKAASYVVDPAADGHQQIREMARIQIESTHASTDAPEDAARNLLARAAQQLSAVVDAPDTVVHRIVHGGDRTSAVELTPSTLAELAELSSWAPLHQPPALALVAAAFGQFKGARQFGVFDTSWHRTMPEEHRVLALPASLRAHGIRHYGFHGLAFQSVMRQLGVIAPALARRRIVLAHLGGGSSLCAVLNGRSVNTTMGMTPLGGILMSTRCGSLDPGVLLDMQRRLGMSPDRIDQVLWRESGLKGISGESGDMRHLLASDTSGARLAIDVYVSRVAQGIAAMAACIGGIDALVFSGGIGTHAPAIRARVIGQLGWMGLDGHDQSSAAGLPNLDDSGSPVGVHVLNADEEKELAIAVS